MSLWLALITRYRKTIKLRQNKNNVTQFPLSYLPLLFTRSHYPSKRSDFECLVHQVECCCQHTDTLIMTVLRCWYWAYNPRCKIQEILGECETPSLTGQTPWKPQLQNSGGSQEKVIRVEMSLKGVCCPEFITVLTSCCSLCTRRSIVWQAFGIALEHWIGVDPLIATWYFALM